MLAENAELSETANLVNAKKHYVRPGICCRFWFIVSIWAAILFLVSAIVYGTTETYYECDPCLQDYKPEDGQSKICRYLPEPHIVYIRHCQMITPNFFPSLVIVVCDILFVVFVVSVYLYHERKLNPNYFKSDI